MATTIKLKSGSGVPLAGDLVAAEPAFDLTNKRLYTENASGTVIEVGTNPTSLTTGTFTSTGIDDNATSTAITIDSSQNVILGSGGLDVSGIGGTYQALNMRAGSGYPVIYGQTTNTATNSAGLQLVGATSGASAGGVAELLGVIQMAAAADSSTNAAGYINFYTSNGSGSIPERMRIDSSGNVGIGTATIPVWNGNAGRKFAVTGPSSNTNAIISLQSGATATDNGAIYEAYSTNTTSGSVALGSIAFLRANTSTTALSSYTAFYTNNAGTVAERMRIDSSGNLLVGTTNTAPGAGNTIAGVAIRGGSDNRSFFSVSSNYVAAFNRNTTDGNIVEFNKDGTSVGSIISISGVVSGIVLDPRTANSGGAGIAGTNADSIIPMDRLGASDADIDLGFATVRWRDLYLSGGAYLGGTAAANQLDDYEEGTWTPVIGGTSGTSGQSYTTQVGHYTKIGRQVIVTFLVDLSNKGTITGDCVLSGLPFACLNDNASGSGVISFFDNLTANVSSMTLNGNQNTTSAYINHVVGSGATATINTTAIIGTSTRLDGVFSYFTS